MEIITKKEAYGHIGLLRHIAKTRKNVNKILMLESANLIERLIRQNLDLQDEIKELKSND